MTQLSSINLLYFNCTHSVYTECKIAFWLYRIVPFTLLTIGVLGNILNFVVLSRRQMRKYSATVYLLFLAGSDMVFLWFSLLPDTIYNITGIRLENYSKFLCRTRVWVCYTSGPFSVWLLALLTIERVLLTKAPVAYRLKLTPRTSFVASMITLLTLATGNIHCIFGFKYYQTRNEIKTEFGDDLLHFPCTFATKPYFLFFRKTWVLMVLLVLNILPGLIIIIGNMCIAVTVYIQKKRIARVQPTIEKTPTPRPTAHPGTSNAINNAVPRSVSSTFQGKQQKNINTNLHASKRGQCASQTKTLKTDTGQLRTHARTAMTKITQKKSRSPTRMLFTLSIFFLLTTFPFCLYFVLKGNTYDLNDKEIAEWRLFTIIAHILGWCNYTFNFFLYFVSGTLFRQECKRLCHKAKVKLQMCRC